MVFCAVCQKDTEHKEEIKNAEVIYECSECGHFIKFPEGSDLKKLLKEHKEANEL